MNGKLTCHQSNGSSTVDYAVISENLYKSVRSFSVLDPNTGSDHCPIKLELTSFIDPNTDRETKGVSNKPPPYQWNDISKQIFARQMDSHAIIKKIEELDKSMDNNDNVDAHVDALSDILM